MQRQYRLKGERSFKLIFKKAQSVGSKALVLLYLKSRTESGLRVGFSVSKKVGNSVKRNYVRRRLKESFRLIINDVEKGYSYIVIAKESASQMNYHQLDSALKYLLVKAGKLGSK